MKWLIFILVVSAIIFFGTAIVILICLATGKMTYEDLDQMVKKEKERKAKKQSSGSAHWLSYPSPLNNWGLWN